MALTSIRLTEWSTLGPPNEPVLRGVTLESEMRRAVSEFGHRIRFRELRAGLEISSNSHVGTIQLGHLGIHVRPKLDSLLLRDLLRYAYGLRELHVLPETTMAVDELGLHELLVCLLAGEVRGLLANGLPRRYVARRMELESPRGRIDVEAMVVRGGIDRASLPCVVDERMDDWLLTRVLRFGVELAVSITEDSLLRRELQRLVVGLQHVGRMPPRLASVDAAMRGLTRQTESYAGALEIIRLLVEAKGIDPDSDVQVARASGYLFDMNLFFQRLLSRFLSEHLSELSVVDEKSVRGAISHVSGQNPRGRQIKPPRPDYTVYRGQKLLGFMDAKYRDLWETSLPTKWLYQLSLYASWAPHFHSILLYATTDPAARDECIQVHRPVAGRAAERAFVTIRPVCLSEMSQLVTRRDKKACERFARALVSDIAAPLRCGQPNGNPGQRQRP